jgi:hypothetical protein
MAKRTKTAVSFGWEDIPRKGKTLLQPKYGQQTTSTRILKREIHDLRQQIAKVKDQELVAQKKVKLQQLRKQLSIGFSFIKNHNQPKYKYLEE